MGTPNLYDLAAETAANTKRIAELLESRSAPGWVEVPKARLAELERIERGHLDIAHKLSLLQGVADRNEPGNARLQKLLGPECAGRLYVDGAADTIEQQRARIAALESEAVAAEALARETLWVKYLRDNQRHEDRSVPSRDFGELIIDAARERVAARASAKGEPAPDDGAFKSAEEDAELVAMGKMIADQWKVGEGEKVAPVGSVMAVGHHVLYCWHYDGRIEPLCYDSDRRGTKITNENRALLRKVRRERGDGR